jgi:hypothetical protein
MGGQAWKSEERTAARLIGGTRYPANGGGLVDCESAEYCAQVKHVRRLSLGALERLAVEAEREGAKRGKAGVVIVKRRGGRGCPTPRLVAMTETVWVTLTAPDSHCCADDTPSGGRTAKRRPVRGANASMITRT